MITHELSKVKNESTHIADFFHPNPVYSVFGRSANMTPKCNPSDCLYYTWKAFLWNDRSRREVHYFDQDGLASTGKRIVERTSVCTRIDELVFFVSSVCGFRSVLFFVVKHVAPSDVRPVTTSHRDLVKSNIQDVICPMILSHRYPEYALFYI